MKNKKVLFLLLALGLYSNNFSEEIKGTVFLENNYLKMKDKKPKIKNKEFQKQIDFTNIWKNKEGLLNLKTYNETGNVDVHENSIGLLATGEETKISNEGVIKVDKGGIGMSTLGSAQMENGVNGQIDLTGSKAIGMLNDSGAKAINYGEINLNGENFTSQKSLIGMFTSKKSESINAGKIAINGMVNTGIVGIEESKIENRGEIDLKGAGSKGIVLENSILNNSGQISIKDRNNIGIFASENSNINNSGQISIRDRNNIGIFASKNSNINNNGEILIKEWGNIGIFASENSNIKNIGNITVSGAFENRGAYIENSKFENFGKLLINGNTVIGVEATNKSQIENNEEVEINGGRNKVFYIGDSKLNNNGKVIINGNENTGIEANNFSEIENKGDIEITGDSNRGIVTHQTKLINNNLITMKGRDRGFNEGIVASDNSQVLNTGNILIEELNNMGLVIKDSKVENSGEITIINGLSSGAMSLINSQGKNTGNINISGDNNRGALVGDSDFYNTGKVSMKGKQNIGIYVTRLNGKKAINDGEIEIIGDDNEGLYANNESSVNNTGKIVVNGMSNTGIGIYNSYVENKGNLDITGKDNVGLELNEKSKVENSGNILINGDKNMAINAFTNSQIKNSGNILINGNKNRGIGAFTNSQIENTGNIIINGNNNIGIEISYGTTLLNKGNIEIKGENNVGIYTERGESNKIINEGNIEISGKNNGGIYINSGTTLENTGKIIINGEESSNLNSYDENGNIPILNKGTILNGGSIVSDREFDVDSMGSGKFIMEKNSTLEAKKIKGDIYLSSKITTGSLKDTYETNKMFDTKEMNAKLLSNSLLFNSKLVNNKNHHDGVLERKNFSEVVKDSNLANYLETNYVDTNNSNKISFYDKYKLISTQEGMDNLIDDTFGNSLFPAFQKQNFEIISLNNNILKNNVSKSSMKEDFKYIAGGAYNKIDSDSSEKIQGYNSSLKNMWIGAEKRIDDNKKLGFVLSVGENKSNFTNNSHREDNIYQGTFFINYNKENLNMRTFATFGKFDTDLRREAKSFNTSLNSDFDTKYFVSSNEISQRFNFERGIYVTPKISLNLYKMVQDKIEEKNGKYGLEIDKNKSFIIEHGLSLNIGKDTMLSKDYVLNTELELNYFNRHRNSNSDLDGKIKSISENSFKLKTYDIDENVGSGKIKISIGQEDWNIYTSYEAKFEKELNSIATFGVNYKF